MVPTRPFPASGPATFAFWLLAAATLLNLNHLFNNIVGTGWFVTLGLALCSMFLVLVVRIPARRTMGLPGCLMLGALASYLIIGLGVTLIFGASLHHGGFIPLRAGLAALIVAAAALGATVTLRRIGLERLLRGILVLLTVTCTSILASSWLVEHVYIELPGREAQIGTTRSTGFSRGANIAGIFACQMVVVALCLLNGGRYRVFAALAAIVGSAAVMSTFSRTAMLALALVFLYFLWSSSPLLRLRRLSVGVWLVIAVIVGALVVAAVNLEHLPISLRNRDRVMWILSLGESANQNLNVRFDIWRLALSRIAEAPFFGHGLSQFHVLEGAPDACSNRRPCGSHSAYLMLWGEAGILPLTLFLLVIGSLLWIRLRSPGSVAGDAVAGYVVVLAMDSLTSDGTPYAVWHAFFLGVTCAVAAHGVRESRERRAGRRLEARPAAPGSAAPGSVPSVAG